jgi:hypothetical protein
MFVTAAALLVIAAAVTGALDGLGKTGAAITSTAPIATVLELVAAADVDTLGRVNGLAPEPADDPGDSELASPEVVEGAVADESVGSDGANLDDLEDMFYTF